MKHESIGSFTADSSTPEVAREQLSFEKLNSIIDETDVTVYEELNNTNPEAEAEFFADPSLAHPPNQYGKLNPEKVMHNLGILEQAADEIEESDISEKQKRFLRLIQDSNYKKNNFLAANIAYNEAVTPEDKAAAAEYHREANEALYGKPDEDTFYALLSEQLASIDVENLRPEDRMAYDKLLSAIGPVKESAMGRFQPKPETLSRFTELANDFYGNLFDAIPEGQETFTPQEAADIVNKILEDNFDDTSYHATVAPNRKIASVDHLKREITFPGARVSGDYDRQSLKIILAHEFGAHTLRAVPYEKQGIAAFSREFPDNETWDEGVAKAMEYAVSGELQTPGVGHYINIGLATFKDKNFREVLDIHSMIKFLSEVKPDETDDKRAARMQKIRKQLFHPVQRCFRGTGELPNNKDLAYYNGANMVWQYIEEHIDDPELFTNLFLAGKTVASDKDHERFVYEMHVDGLNDSVNQ